MNKLILILSLFALAACTTPIEIKSKPISKAPLVLPSVDEYAPRQVKFIIVTKENIDEILSKHLVLFALTAKGYEALSLNTTDIKKLIQQLLAKQKALGLYYIEN